jgi:hypothetical protein
MRVIIYRIIHKDALSSYLHGLTAEIAETAEEPWGIEIRLRRGCLAAGGAIYSTKAV